MHHEHRSNTPYHIINSAFGQLFGYWNLFLSLGV